MLRGILRSQSSQWTKGFRQTVRQYSSSKSSDIADKAVESAFKSSATWKNVPVEEKRDIFYNASKLLKERREELVKLTNQEVGIPSLFAGFFVDDAVDFMTTMGDLVTNSGYGQFLPPVKGRQPIVVREPIGPVFGIVPWNAPTILGLRAAACPLAAGCSVVVKTSEYTPLTQRLTLQTLTDAGVPEGVVNILEVPLEDSPAVVEQVISDFRIRKVNFTGSGRVGAIVAGLAGTHLKPILLELGGKAAAIVDETADFETAARNIVLGAWANSGQICMSTERIFVTKEAADGFNKAITKVSHEELNQDYLQCRQISPVNSKRIEQLAKDAVSKGATSIVNGIPKAKDGDVSKSILTNVSQDSELFDSETFAPLAFFNIVDSVDQAIDLVNSSKFGLNSSVWTADTAKGIEIARKINSGTVHINGNTVFDHGSVPHGGVKNSGFGRFNGQWGIDEFTVIKTITYPV
ncbi:aldehyde dehydrogenase (NAD(P)(+)) ALD5 [Sugiyamaella lignohabitans]|uniref:Aldehyde dehydrogenase (NAD(P)(+)) ALD5 n=1 Tax=Sugiyamaella lignohabitans TaxID=796027 RepID=A0A167C2F8_9ASCO|nr:aldehyde dehydrogenase (NAD(P)(+)) ALD5 [Sugiyamaella lignohabitans]ANB11136.1 aldehyde dehydrogenase (NAD(P)(+)) ALD5 [Sugiyamaella lignohabitans]